MISNHVLFSLFAVIKCNREEVTTPDKGNVKCIHEYGDFSYDSSCQYSCEEGYNLSMSRPLTCTASTQWSEQPPTCECELSCVYIWNNHIQSNRNELSHCSNMFLMVLSSTVIQCPKLSSPVRGSMKCSDPLGPSSFQSSCVFTCDEGYELAGSPSDTLQCEASGLWNASQPFCVGTTTFICFHLAELYYINAIEVFKKDYS